MNCSFTEMHFCKLPGCYLSISEHEHEYPINIFFSMRGEGWLLHTSSLAYSCHSWKHFTHLLTVAGFNTSSLYTVDSISLVPPLIPTLPKFTRNFTFNRCSIFFYTDILPHTSFRSISQYDAMYTNHTNLLCCRFFTLLTTLATGLQTCSVAFAAHAKLFY